jgi:HPt (histidine-containing phosphotransfer) domain-containing protein
MAAMRAAGASHVLSKPIDRADLIGILAQALPLGVPSPAARPRPAAASGLLRPAVLAELAEAIGADAVEEAVQLFRATAERRVAGALRALAAGELAEAGREAHALKSSAAMLGAVALSEAMVAIERAALSRDSAAAEAAGARLRGLLEESLAALDAALAEPVGM